MKRTLQIGILLAGLGLAYMMGTAGRSLPAKSSSQAYLDAFHACAQAYPDASLEQWRACAQSRTQKASQ